jgi:hypothetical protein
MLLSEGTPFLYVTLGIAVGFMYYIDGCVQGSKHSAREARPDIDADGDLGDALSQYYETLGIF